MSATTCHFDVPLQLTPAHHEPGQCHQLGGRTAAAACCCCVYCASAEQLCLVCCLALLACNLFVILQRVALPVTPPLALKQQQGWLLQRLYMYCTVLAGGGYGRTAGGVEKGWWLSVLQSAGSRVVPSTQWGGVGGPTALIRAQQ